MDFIIVLNRVMIFLFGAAWFVAAALSGFLLGGFAASFSPPCDDVEHQDSPTEGFFCLALIAVAFALLFTVLFFAHAGIPTLLGLAFLGHTAIPVLIGLAFAGFAWGLLSQK